MVVAVSRVPATTKADNHFIHLAILSYTPSVP
jgi:hypothetical protein